MADLALAAVDSGLGRAARLVPGAGYFDARVGAGAAWGGAVDVRARAELGWRPLESLSTFVFGEATAREGWQAGVGLRATW